MAKVSKIDLILHTSFPMSYEVHYNAKNRPRFSVKGLPDDFSRVTGVREYGYNTEVELESNIREGVRLYKEAKSSQRKVIAYRVNASVEVRMKKIIESSTSSSYSGLLPGVSRKIGNNGKGATIEIIYEVLMEIDNISRKKYYPIKEGALGYETHLESNTTVIEWTQEREDFFASIYDAMRSLVVKMSDFIEKDEEAISLLVASRQKFLE